MKPPALWPVSTDLAGLRDLIGAHADQAGVSKRKSEDLLLAVTEAVGNVLEHAGGHGHVHVWCDERYLTVDVCDEDGRLAPGDLPARRPSVSMRPTSTGSLGLGLWLIRHVCDEAAVLPREGGSRVRMRMRRTRR